MESDSLEKITKFIQRLRYLVSQLEDQQNLSVHQKVNQFYYMTRMEELKILLGQYEEETKRLNTIRNRIETRYEETFHHWRKDVRWLNEFACTKR